MTDVKHDGNDPFGGFVVVTEVKADGRLIHYYEWPDDPDPDEASVQRPERTIRHADAHADV
ncbi:MAG TPA: hypothetical protein VH723_09830 [Candidatus Limnocylindrales bacterium]